MDRRKFIKKSTLAAGMLGISEVSSSNVFSEYAGTGTQSDKSTESGQKLSFNEDGRFKIVQFTDIHWKSGVIESEEALVCMNNVLDAERPDFVFYTGDHVTAAPVSEGLDVIFEPVISRRIPFAATLGNHDDEHDLTRREIYEYMSGFPGNLTRSAEGVSGVTNFDIPLYASKGDRVASVIYSLDTNHSSVFLDQVWWYTQRSDEYTRRNDGKPLPGIAFFHIPFPEFQEAIKDENARFYGTRKERVAGPKVNAGLFSAFLEKGDVMAAIVGHDHLNDYVVCWKEIMLCYGRVTGSQKTTYHNLPDGGNGSRVVVLKEGERGFESWIRLGTGEKIKPFKYPFDFIDR